MFNSTQLESIDALLEEGITPEEVATRFEMSRSTFILRLLMSGKRIVTYRRLEDAAPVENPREVAAA